MKKSMSGQTITPGDKVTFNTDKIELFNTETRSSNPSTRQYRQLVLAGINQVGTVKESAGNMLTVSFPDGRVLPVAAKYFILLPSIKDI